MNPPYRIVLSCLALASCLPAAAETVRGFPHYPRKSNPAGMIAGPDGYLYGVNMETFPGGNGEVFRMEPDGKLKVLHRFGQLRTFPGSNDGGSTPTHVFTMGKDGCFYGLTRSGGRFARGVLYRVRPDGEFSVVMDLQPDGLITPPLEATNFAYGAHQLIEGPDNAFYTFSAAGHCVRLGLDGSMSVVANVGPLTRVFTDPAEPTHAIVAYKPGLGPNNMRMRRVRITDGAVLSDVTCPTFPSPTTGVKALAYSSRGLLLDAEWAQGTTGGSRLHWMNADGSVDFVDDFRWSPAPSHPPFIQSFVHAGDDGTIHYLAGYSTKGIVSGGDSLIEYKPNGTHRMVCGFGDYSMFGFCQVAPDMIYGATLGTSLFAPSGFGFLYYENWMKRGGDSKLVQEVKGGGMFFQVAGDDSRKGDYFPLAQMDVVNSKGNKELLISPLKNDRDPAREKLRLVSVGQASQGSASIPADPKLKDRVLYTPAEGGRRSAIIPYVVEDESERQSKGTIWFQGNAAGTYQAAGAISGDDLKLKVTPRGTFTATIAGEGRPLTFSGALDWSDSATVSIPGGTNQVLTLRISLVTPEDAPPMFSYVLSISTGGAFAGFATLPD